MGDQDMIWLGRLLKTYFITNSITYNILNNAYFHGLRFSKILKGMTIFFYFYVEYYHAIYDSWVVQSRMKANNKFTL
jgi:hypothetical protein